MEPGENTQHGQPRPIVIGTAGWSIPATYGEHFTGAGTHLVRYARNLPGVEINSSFYKPHRPATYQRWADSVPEGFRFAVKIPKETTHRHKLVDTFEALDRFLDEVAALGSRLGPLLVQLPPTLSFEAKAVVAFFSGLRTRFNGDVVCEPRHITWFGMEAERTLKEFRVARVAADPALTPEAAQPGGWPEIVYFRLHGSPRMYYSAYSEQALATLASRLRGASPSATAWCIFDNTAAGSATGNAIDLMEQLRRRSH